jgi:hypothetical protein
MRRFDGDRLRATIRRVGVRAWKWHAVTPFFSSDAHVDSIADVAEGIFPAELQFLIKAVRAAIPRT